MKVYQLLQKYDYLHTYRKQSKFNLSHRTNPNEFRMNDENSEFRNLMQIYSPTLKFSRAIIALRNQSFLVCGRLRHGSLFREGIFRTNIHPSILLLDCPPLIICMVNTSPAILTRSDRRNFHQSIIERE